MKQSALFFLLATHFSIAANAQYEWRMNSAGRYVYEKTVTVNTGASTSNRSSSGSSTTTSSKNKYENMVVFNEGFAAVSKNGKYGFIDEYDKLVIPFTYDIADNFFQGRAIVQLYGLYGYINTSGTVVIPAIYAKAERFESNTAKVEKGNERYKIYRDGKTASTLTLIDPNKKRKVSYDYKGSYGSNGVAIVGLNSKYGLVDLSDNVVISVIYEYISPLRTGNKTDAKLNGKWGVVNIKNEVVIPFIYDHIFIEGLFYTAALDNKWGTIDSLGKIIIPFKYEKIDFFEDGLALVQLNKKWGYIDEKGKTIIPIKYDQAILSLNQGRYYDQLFVVGIKNKMGVINKANKIILPLIYDEVTLSRYGFISTMLNSKAHSFDTKGKPLN